MRTLTIIILAVIGISYLSLVVLPFLAPYWLSGGELYKPVSFLNSHHIEGLVRLFSVLFAFAFLVAVYLWAVGKERGQRLRMWAKFLFGLFILLLIQVIVGSVRLEGFAEALGFYILVIIAYFIILLVLSLFIALLANRMQKLVSTAFLAALITSAAYIILALTEWFVRKMPMSFGDKVFDSVMVSLLFVFPASFLLAMLVKFIILEFKQKS